MRGRSSGADGGSGDEERVEDEAPKSGRSPCGEAADPEDAEEGRRLRDRPGGSERRSEGDREGRGEDRPAPKGIQA